MTGALGTLPYDEVAVAVSDAADGAALRGPRGGGAGAGGGHDHPAAGRAARAFGGVARLNLSIDSYKGAAEPARIDALAGTLKAAHPALEIVLLATLDTPAFATRLVDEGLLAALVALPSVDKVALNALKPPPPWCDRAFGCARWPAWSRSWPARSTRACSSTATSPRAFCTSAAARPAPTCRRRRAASPSAACVYQPSPDFVAADATSLAARLDGFRAPAACPFTIT